jgi:hypothetical protein
MLVASELDQQLDARLGERQGGVVAHMRELVPATVLNEHARDIDVGDFSNPAFAVRYRT